MTENINISRCPAKYKDYFEEIVESSVLKNSGGTSHNCESSQNESTFRLLCKLGCNTKKGLVSVSVGSTGNIIRHLKVSC